MACATPFLFIMKTIRQNCFETNSSSSHSVTIANGYGEIVIPHIAKFEHDYEPGVFLIKGGEFGWENAEYNDIETKLEYAYTLATGNYDKNHDPETNEYLKMLFEVLKENIEGITEFRQLEGWYYVDHQSQDLIHEIFESKETLRDFIFNKESELTTGNDNEW